MVNKHCYILKIKRNFEQIFTELPIIAFRRNRNLQNILGKKTIVNSRKQLCQNFNQNGYLKHCNSKLNNLCCIQVQSTNTFRSTVTNKSSKYTINSIANTNCKIAKTQYLKLQYLIYLMECVLCIKQYTRKS